MAKERRPRSAKTLLPTWLFQRRCKSRDKCVNQLDVTICARQPVRELRELYYFRAGRTGHLFGYTPIMKRLNNDCFDVLRFHLRYHFREMGRRWRNSRFWFKKNVDIHTKAVREVRP